MYRALLCGQGISAPQEWIDGRSQMVSGAFALSVVVSPSCATNCPSQGCWSQNPQTKCQAGRSSGVLVSYVPKAACWQPIQGIMGIDRRSGQRSAGLIMRTRFGKLTTGSCSTTPRMSLLAKATTENTAGTEQQVFLALNAGDLCLLKNGSKRFKCGPR
jgi:hypothetical protein